MTKQEEELQPYWNVYLKLRAEGDKLMAEGNKLRAEGNKIRAEGDKLMAEGNKLRAEGNKIRAEGDKLWAEGDKLSSEGNKLRAEGKIVFLDAVLRLHGNVSVEWSRTNCTVSDCMTFKIVEYNDTMPTINYSRIEIEDRLLDIEL